MLDFRIAGICQGNPSRLHQSICIKVIGIVGVSDPNPLFPDTIHKGHKPAYGLSCILICVIPLLAVIDPAFFQNSLAVKIVTSFLSVYRNRLPALGQCLSVLKQMLGTIFQNYQGVSAVLNCSDFSAFFSRRIKIIPFTFYTVQAA